MISKFSFLVTIFLFVLMTAKLTGQDIPQKNVKSQKYLFYLHGAIVQEQGINAVSEEFGRYEYLAIIDTLKNYGYKIISEVRPENTIIIDYAHKVSQQIDSLILYGTPPENITVVGASQGAYITIETAYLQKNAKVNYVIMALCNEYNVNFFLKYKEALCGNWLSIYESSDQKLSCQTLLKSAHCKSGFREVALKMGNGHGFIYKPYGEWVHPLINWIESKLK